MKAITAALLLSLSMMAVAQLSPEEIAAWRAEADKGEVWAQYNLGNMYDMGYGVPEDDATAVKWYTKAAEQGLADAQNSLGFAYANGLGVPKDDATAVKWYTKAAEQGLADAQKSLGLNYAMGIGVPKDNVMAYMWLILAAAQGDETAKKGKGIVRESITPAQTAEAQMLSRECLAKDFKNCG